MNRSHTKSKRKKESMKNTHELQDIDGLIQIQLEIMQNGATLKEKKEARRKILTYEKFKNDVNYKKLNGKVYPEKIYHSDNKPMNVPEILALIDSVPDSEGLNEQEYHEALDEINSIDLSGDTKYQYRNKNEST